MASSAVGQPAALLQQQLLPQAPPSQQQARLDAYKKVMKIFMQGSYDLAKEDALASLRSALAISEQEHLSARAAAMADAQHHLQLHQPPSQAGGPAPEPSVGHSSQPLAQAAPADAVPPGSRAGGGGGGAAGAKRAATPGSGGKPAAGSAPPRKRTRAGEPTGAAAGKAGKAAPAAAGDVDPLVGHVVLRHWPNDGGWFRGIISDYRPSDGAHCIIYGMGKPTESFEWYHIRGASPEDCVVKEEKVDFATLNMPPGAGAGPASPPVAAPPASKSKKAGGSGSGQQLRGAAAASAAAAAAKRAAAAAAAAGSEVARQGAGASKAGAPRPSAASSKAGGGGSGSKPSAAARAAASKSPPATAATAAAATQQQAAPQPPAPATQQQQQPHRNGKTHHAHLANGLSSHAAALKQVLAAGGRPPYLTGPSLLPRRTRSWSSDEEDSDDEDDE